MCLHNELFCPLVYHWELDVWQSYFLLWVSWGGAPKKPSHLQVIILQPLTGKDALTVVHSFPSLLWPSLSLFSLSLVSKAGLTRVWSRREVTSTVVQGCALPFSLCIQQTNRSVHSSYSRTEEWAVKHNMQINATTHFLTHWLRENENSYCDEEDTWTAKYMHRKRNNVIKIIQRQKKELWIALV